MSTFHFEFAPSLPILLLGLVGSGFFPPAYEAAAAPAELPGDQILRRYFEYETARLAHNLAPGVLPHDQTGSATGDRAQLRDMLGLGPWLERTELHAQVTGRIEREDFVVEKLHFQSLPGLYVTANLYLPKSLKKPAPTILYVCGHSPQIKHGVSYGNKVAYQRHGIWFARNGYVCLLIDTLQLGEIQGIHHGTYRERRWWWNSRGYTPAGVETWNGIRALDYLETRPEVDASRFGITGRSGGGAYAWFISALDERIKVAAPVAGITDLRNHVLDGTVEGHCDCMFFLNTHLWDYPNVAALVAPRPLLLASSDHDDIFPLDGVLRVHEHLRRCYAAKGAAGKLGLLITPGPHRDTQELRVGVFHWFNHWLKGKDEPIVPPAEPLFEPAELKVFDRLPADEINTAIDETFVPAARLPRNFSPGKEGSPFATWDRQTLLERSFRTWASRPIHFDPDTARKIARFGETDVWLAQVPVHSTFTAPLLLLRQQDHPRSAGPTLLVVCRELEWQELGIALHARLSQTPILGELALSETPPTPQRAAAADAPTSPAQAKAWFAELLRTGRTVAFFAPRGIGPTAWGGDERRRTHIRRRFMLLGQTLDGMRVWDIRAAIRALSSLQERPGQGVLLRGVAGMALNAVLASLYEPSVTGLDLTRLPGSYREAPDYLAIAREVPLPGLVALAVADKQATLRETPAAVADFVRKAAAASGWANVHVE